MNAGIPLADAHSFRTRAIATRVVLAALAAAAAAAAVGVLLASRFSHSQTLVLLPSNASVVIVLDLSASIPPTASRASAPRWGCSREAATGWAW